METQCTHTMTQGQPTHQKYRNINKKRYLLVYRKTYY